MAAVAPQVLKLELKDIRAQQDLLFRFMSFLKREGAVHVLQFLLTVGEPSPQAPPLDRRACGGAVTSLRVCLLQRSSTTGSCSRS